MVIISLEMVAGKEADEKRAAAQRVYISYMIRAAGGKLYHLGLRGEGDSSEAVRFH